MAKDKKDLNNKSNANSNEIDTLCPSTEPIYGSPETSFENVNKFGTYEIQPTADTQNGFPEIRQGFPTKNRDKCAPDVKNIMDNKDAKNIKKDK